MYLLLTTAAVILLLSQVSVTLAKTFNSAHLLFPCNWQDVFFAAARGTITFDTSVCAESDADFENQIDRILQIVDDEKQQYGSAYNQTLIVGFTRIGQVSDQWARALRVEGVVVFFFEDGVDAEYYNLNLNTAFMAEFYPDNERGAIFNGEELCRVSPTEHKNIVLYYGKKPALDFRVDTALEAYISKCPGATYTVLHSLRGDWSAEKAYDDFRNIFLLESNVNTVISANDRMATGIVRAAEEILGPTKAAQLMLTGFDNNPDGQGLIQSKRMVATVDQSVNYANFGVWQSMALLKDRIEQYDGHINGTTGLQRMLGVNRTLLVTDVLPISADQEGYISSRVYLTYDKAVRAVSSKGYGATEISVELIDVEFEEVDVADGSFVANFWLVLEWTDKRFSWLDLQYNNTLRKKADDLWTPDIFFRNAVSSRLESDIYESSASISPSGQVTMARKYTGWFTCDMEIYAYPYDIHTCSILLSAASTNEVLVPVGRVQNLAGDAAAYEAEFLSVDTSTDPDSPLTVLTSMLEYSYKFTHRPRAVVLNYLLISWALNVLSFTQFWLSLERGVIDRSGIALVCILSNAVISTEAKISALYTYADLYFSISMAFLIFAFFTTVLAASSLDTIVENTLTKSTINVIKKELKRHKQASTISHMYYFMWGAKEHTPQDRFSRRVICPTFFLISMVFPFLPPRGVNMSIEEHPSSGVASPLFWLNLLVILLYLVVTVTKHVLNYYETKRKCAHSQRKDTSMSMDDLDAFLSMPMGEVSSSKGPQNHPKQPLQNGKHMDDQTHVVDIPSAATAVTPAENPTIPSSSAAPYRDELEASSDDDDDDDGGGDDDDDDYDRKEDDDDDDDDGFYNNDEEDHQSTGRASSGSGGINYPKHVQFKTMFEYEPADHMPPSV